MNDKHHIWFPRYDYESGVAKKFRQIPCHIVEMDIDDHRAYHALCFKYPELVPSRPPVDYAARKTNECRRHATCTTCPFYTEKDYKLGTGQG